MKNNRRNIKVENNHDVSPDFFKKDRSSFHDNLLNFDKAVLVFLSIMYKSSDKQKVNNDIDNSLYL